MNMGDHSNDDKTLNCADELRQCGCKGIRTCRLCGSPKSKQNILAPHYGLDKQEQSQKNIYQYCDICKKAWKPNHFAQFALEPGITLSKSKTDAEQLAMHMDDQKSIENKNPNISCTLATKVKTVRDHERQCPNSHGSIGAIPFQGITIIENFISEEEEAFLLASINETNFVNSQSGRRKQDFGPKVNFKKQKIKLSNFNGLPAYSQFIYKRMKAYPCLRNFEPVELCNLEYCSERGAHIDPHLDDAWLWGERLVTLNLLSDTVLTFTLDSDPLLEIHVPLLRRSLIIVSSEARHQWKHSIHEDDISGKRIAMTFRELSQEFCVGGRNEEDGLKLLEIALTFQGKAVGT